MLRLGVISDTHGDRGAIERAVSLAGEVDGWLHLGDFAGDAEAIGRITEKPFYAVLGNCDAGRSTNGEYGAELVVELEGARLLLVHGHRHDIDAYSTYAACRRAEELGCNALVYGHTHISRLMNNGGLLILNPGSPSRPRGGRKPSFAIMEIENGAVRARIVTI